jgi:hypothetical protein
MSETQNEYETEQETDAPITSGPWEAEDQPWEMDVVSGDYAVATVHGFAKDGTIEGNAALIAAAGTAAQEAKEMGYDPQKAVEALPVGLEQARCAIIDLLDGPPGETSAPAVKSAIKRLAFFLGEASNEEVSEIVDDKMLNDALASAEGSGNE